MKPKKFISMLVKISLFLNFINGGVLLNVKWQLPGSRKQIKYLAASVCSNLEFMFRDEASAVACPVNFWNPLKNSTHQIKVKLRCRSKGTVKIEVTPSDSWQVAVLVPDTSEKDEIINYSLIEPNARFSEISVYATSNNYTIYSTVLSKDGRPYLWHGQGKVVGWSDSNAPEHRNYDVKIRFVNSSTEERVVTGVVTWNHTGDSDVCFDFTNYCTEGRLKTMKIWPDKGQRVVIEKLPLNDKCEIQIDGMYGTTTLKYLTPGQEEKLKNVMPEIPQKVFLVATEDGNAWKVRAGWAKPTNPPDLYIVTLGANDNKTLVFPGNTTEVIFYDVKGEGLYNMSIIAVKHHYEAHTFKRALFPVRRWAMAANGAWIAASVCIFALVFCWIWMRKKFYENRKPKGPETKPLDDKLEFLEPDFEDQWEVKPENLLLHEVIGEGAFGVVKRGILAPAEKEVAVKMLKDFPSQDEVRAFRLEMELMKSVRAHPHVVSLVGCCSGKQPFIIAEYCARGDLLSFLRYSWDMMVSKSNHGTKYYNNNETKLHGKTQRETTKVVVNEMYESQGGSDTDLTALDLMSFCRQIAMGMEFLAGNRFVHRDLAARNILVTSDRTLKIADFGLSRDVYEQNQYKQKGNGKLPVKWMALESLTRRIYTSKSDVWSFGVVMWEVLTVGGLPYSEVPSERLLRLLRTGYRMQRPPNCSKQLYELMLSCWRVNPRERPSFTALHTQLDELLNSACAYKYLCLELDNDHETPTPPTPKAQRYLNILIRGRQNKVRESYERPLKAQGNYNRYTSPPATHSIKGTSVTVLNDVKTV